MGPPKKKFSLFKQTIKNPHLTKKPNSLRILIDCNLSMVCIYYNLLLNFNLRNPTKCSYFDCVMIRENLEFFFNRDLHDGKEIF